MRGLVQRVSEASVTVAGEEVGRVGPGLCVLVGAGAGDDEGSADRLAAKLWHLRVFPDDAGNMNRSAAELGFGILVVSQFTLYGDVRRGRRPSFAQAAPQEQARTLVERVVAQLRSFGAEVATGTFGAMMQVRLINEGPVTIMVET